VSLMTKTCKEELNRLLETSPDIEEGILIEFYRTFTEKKASVCCGMLCGRGAKVTDEERAEFDKIKKPDICGIMRTTADFRHPWGTSQETQTEISSEERNSVQLIEYRKETTITDDDCLTSDGQKEDCKSRTDRTSEQITLEIA